MIEDLIMKTRSVRRFIEEPIKKGTLLDFVNLAKLSASGANLQPLKYVISYDAETNCKIFPHLMWAGYLKEWKGPPMRK